MDSDIVARIEEWDPRPAPGGYEGLRDLAAAEFSGAVTAGRAWLFMLNGRIVGIVDGAMEAFEDADAQAYEAPDPGLPLLFAMLERGGETAGQYYTDDTPLSEVDGMLSDEGFTGYVELSENVLSGDYYVVYYGGRSMSVAFVGNEERLYTGEEAFERADDEVGIYEVTSVDLDVTEVPEPAAGEDGGATSTGGEEGGTGEAGTESADAGADEAGTGTEEPTEAESEVEPATEEPPETGGTDEPVAGGEVAEAGAATEDSPEPDGVTEPETDVETPDEGVEEVETGGAPEPATSEAEPAEGESSATASAVEEGEDPFSEEEEWRETRTIPALDPEETERPHEAGTEEASREATAEADPAPDARSDRIQQARERLGELQSALEEREETIGELERRLESAQSEREELRAELEDVRAERDRLRERLEAAGEAGGEGPALDPEDALSRTDLFVRYGSKGEATLEEAHDGEADRADVEDNLRLEVHTRFEQEGATVDGRAFETFLEGTLEYRFAAWLVTDLLYEIRETGAERDLGDLYDTLPEVDRVAFNDAVASRDEAGEEVSRSFDVVLRDRMGQPLAVADTSADRDPATGEMMADLIERTTTVAEGNGTLSAAVLVTASFFEPGALETADGATGGGFLNRESRRSFVRLSRKQGYHLCLVEARDEEFHVAVPEL